MADIYIVIAAYNEGQRISKVVLSLLKAGYTNVVVVDDGSYDSTFNAASAAGATTLRHIINRGQGAALKTGINYALSQQADIIVTFDADGQHMVQDISKMISPIITNNCDITLGSRFLSNEQVPFARKLTLKIAILIVWIFYGMRMTDAHNGFRAMNRKAAGMIEITSDRMEHASQIIEEIHTKNLRYKEIPVKILYTEYSLKHGHGGIVQAIRVLVGMVWRKLLN